MIPLHREAADMLAQEQARELNEQGCFSIEVGHYDRAIVLLTDALNTIETMRLPSSRHMFTSSCGLDVCMEYTQSYNNLVNHGIRTATSSSHAEKSAIDAKHVDNVPAATNNGFIYKQPFRIPQQAISEGRSLGQTLPLVVVFNLALAHHLKAISKSNGGILSSRCREHLENILHLYEMAYHWHIEQERDRPSSPSSGLSSLKLIMILANNLAQIHLAVNSMTKYRLCLQHLLSTMMFMVDGLQFSPQSRPATDALFPPIELDGFLRNASCLFLRDQAAAAA